jgi:hypothetical protein
MQRITNLATLRSRDFPLSWLALEYGSITCHTSWVWLRTGVGLQEINIWLKTRSASRSLTNSLSQLGTIRSGWADSTNALYTKDPGLILSKWVDSTTAMYTKDPGLILSKWVDSTPALYTKDPGLTLSGWVDNTAALYMKDPGLILSKWVDSTTALHTKDLGLILSGWVDSNTALCMNDPGLFSAVELMVLLLCTQRILGWC